MEPKGNQKEAKVSQGTFKHTTCGTGSKSDEERSIPRTKWKTLFIVIDQTTSQKY